MQARLEIEALKNDLLRSVDNSLSEFEAFKIASDMYRNQYLYDIRNHFTQQHLIAEEEARMALTRENRF